MLNAFLALVLLFLRLLVDEIAMWLDSRWYALRRWARRIVKGK
jgi:hypothetical protein